MQVKTNIIQKSNKNKKKERARKNILLSLQPSRRRQHDF